MRSAPTLANRGSNFLHCAIPDLDKASLLWYFCEMEVNESTRPDYKYTVALNESETIVTIAAYREHVFSLSSKGNSGSIHPFDVALAEWDNKELYYYTNDNSGTEGVLRDFHERTDEAITSIPSETNLPPYANPHIGSRYKLGQQALILADKMTEGITVKEFRGSLDELPEVAEPRLKE
jgi:hypothetical protein